MFAERTAPIFISYASADRNKVSAIADQIQSAGVPVWIDVAGITGGESYGTEIAQAIKDASVLLVMISPASVGSRNVRQEIMLAWRYETPIVPVLLTATNIPDDVAYWLEGAGWIDAVNCDGDQLLSLLRVTLARNGVEIALTGNAEETPQTAGLQHLDRSPQKLYGRESEIRELLALLEHSRWITLTGPGGGGKTSLAIEVGNRAASNYPGGAWFVDLSPLDDPDDLIPQIASVLGVMETPGIAATSQIADHIGDQKTLLLLDNLEHLLPAANHLQTLLQMAPGLTLLITSRIPTGMANEWSYSVPLLKPPGLDSMPPLATLINNPSVALFVARAREAKPDFVLSDANARSVVEICGRLDGLPLAIELAAARVRLLPPAVILSRLGSQLNLLSRGDQTLRGAIAWSYDLLTVEEQTDFRRLSVFIGSFSVERAIQVLQLKSSATIDSLVQQNLLRSAPEIAGQRRLAMLQSIREFAAEQLEHSGELASVKELWALSFSDSVLGSAGALLQPRPGEVIRNLAADDADISGAMMWLLESASQRRELIDRTQRTAELLVHYRRAMGQYSRAERSVRDALDLSNSDNLATRADLLSALGFLASIRRDYREAGEHYAEALAIRQMLGDETGAGVALQSIGRSAADLGEYATANAALMQALQIFRDADDQSRIPIVLQYLGFTATSLGDYTAAENYLAEALELVKENNEGAEDLGIILTELGNLEMYKGDFDSALRYQTEAATIWRAIGDQYAESVCLVNSGRALQLAGRVDEAREMFLATINLVSDQPRSLEGSLAHYGLGLLELAKGNLQAAKSLVLQSLAVEHQAGDPWHVAERLEALAAIEVELDPIASVRLLGAAAGLREQSSMPVPAIETEALEATVEKATVSLGEESFAFNFAGGKSANVDQIINEALAESA